MGCMGLILWHGKGLEPAVARPPERRAVRLTHAYKLRIRFCAPESARSSFPEAACAIPSGQSGPRGLGSSDRRGTATRSTLKVFRSAPS